MKKLFVLLLVLALLIPMGLVPVAGADGEVTVQPFYALGWSDFDETKFPYLDGLVKSTFSNMGDKATLSYGGATLICGRYTDADVTKFAEAMKKTMDARSEGLRYWKVFGPTSVLKLAPKHVIYLDHGVVQLKELMTAVLKKMREIGCPLDGVVVDTEYIGMSSWYLYANTSKNSNNYTKNKKIYAQIVADPRYATEVRPLLEERGFPFWTDITDTQSEIFSICNTNKGEQYDLARSIWDTVMRIRLNQYVNDWCYTPLKEYFPEASLSDYQSHDSKSWLKLASITDDGVELSGGNSIRVGTASCFSFYYARPTNDFYNNMQQYASFNDAVYEASAFNTLLYDTNFAKHMYASTDTKQIAPWITSYIYNSDKKGTIANTPYYSELLYHLGMLDPEPFLSYTYVNDYSDDNKADYNSEKYILAQQIQNELMAELTRVAGFSDRKPIETGQYWNTEFILSGMYANGRNIWRVTPNTDEISLADFKVEGTDPTFSVKGRTVTFPGGKIIEDTAISTAGSCGYWVETAAGVSPIITHDADRYAKYPSLLENFDKYPEGVIYSSTVKPPNTLTLTRGKDERSDFQIVSNGTGKALSLIGDVTVQSVKLPAKITAGDSFAEDQVWEITVTIPEGLSADATINLLSYIGTSQQTDDGGFKIASGKVYYSDNGEYEELTDISAGTYTLKRVVNFNDIEKFTSCYYVFDASGKELGSVKDVAAPVFDNLTTISFVTNQADKAVLLDDYKLYPTGITTDFEIYDAITGMNVTGESKEVARDKSTAYRLSWLNGTDTEKYVTVMAAIYEGETLIEEKAIQEVQMRPGYDNVETGVVEVAQGQRVKVYLKDGQYTSPDAPNAPDAPDSAGEKAVIGLPQIALIVVTLLSVLAVVIALVATKPKKKAEAPKAENDKTEEPKAEE